MTEHQQAKAWREAQGLTLVELADLTGYSVAAVHLFERGRNSENRPHNAKAWQRYKLACLAVDVLRRHHLPLGHWQWPKPKRPAVGSIPQA